MEGQEAVVYGILSIIPPLIAIILCIVTRQVIPSLLLGIFSGVMILNAWNPGTALLDTFSKYIVGKGIADPYNAGLITFCLIIGGMVGVINKSGGMVAIAEAIAKRAKSKQSTQFATTILGTVVFIDDYASCMITGNTMRPITDAQNISREKLSFIVDATAAAISSIIPVSTWIATELGLIKTGLESVGIQANPLIVFVQTIPGRFYIMFLIIFIFVMLLTKKDYGPMLKAEIRARKTGEVYAKGAKPMISDDKEILPDPGIKGSIWNAVVPILAFIVSTVLGLWYNGYEAGLAFRDCLGNADASVVLTWASGIGSMVAILMNLLFTKMKFGKIIDSWINGAKSMLYAVIILTLALTIKAVVSDLGMATYIVEVTKSWLSGPVVPLLIFLIACGTAFATGTSWGTMAILMPIAIPISWAVAGNPTEVVPLMNATIAAVLAGAIYGDHCSPISDTTILASLASGSDHIAHVNTQLPYATTIAVISAIIGYIPAGFGVNPWISIAFGTVVIVLVFKFFGKKIDDQGNIIK